MLVPDLIALFLRVTAARHRPQTVRCYASRLKLFGAEYADREFRQLTPAHLTTWLLDAGAGRSDSTKHANAVVLGLLQAFAVEQGELPAPLLAKIPKPSIGLRDRLPTAAETAALLKRAARPFRAIYQALRTSGARPNELCRARIEDWDRAAQQIVLQEHKTMRKTRRPRRIPVGKRLAAQLVAAAGGRQAGPIFLSPRGKAWTVSHLSSTFRQLRDRAGLPKDLILYLTRHECGSKICKRHGVLAAKDMLGHSSVQTTQRYVHFDQAELREMQDG